MVEGGKDSRNFLERVVRKPKGMRWPRSLEAITRKVRPPAEDWGVGKSLGDLVMMWMKFLDWSIVLCSEVVWVRRGRTRDTKEEALDEAEAVCSVSTVVLCAMHALGGVSWGSGG